MAVAGAVGPSNILARLGGGDSLERAASVISKGLTVEGAPGSAVIYVKFKALDPSIVQPVLSQIISNYLTTQAEIHQTAGTGDDALMRQTDELRREVEKTDQAILKAKKQFAVLSLDDSRRTYSDRLARLQEDLNSAEADLASRKEGLVEMTNLLTATVTGTNAQPTVPDDKARQYGQVVALLQALDTKEQQLSLQFQPGSTPIQQIESQIKSAQTTKQKLESEYPQLLGMGVVASGTGNKPALTWTDVVNQMLQVKQIQARIAALNSQMSDLQRQIDEFGQAETTIQDLQSKRDLREKYLQSFSANLFNSRINEQINAGRISNISVIQTPTPPALVPTKVLKMVAMVLGGTFGGALALAFVVEFYFDRSFKRPAEMETQLNVPMFISIPRTKLKQKRRGALPPSEIGLLAEQSAGEGSKALVRANAKKKKWLAPWEGAHSLGAHFDALRDRVIDFFETRDLTHKPKLVAVTSCGEGSGVTTIASSLAASLSKTGDGNVLLVDMNNGQSLPSAFFRNGQIANRLDDALEGEKRNGGQVEQRLYVASEKPANGEGQMLHKRISTLMPKLRASDYDYIIFDMPPVSQVSPTTRLTRFMDLTMVVVEAEKTDRDLVKRATNLLCEAKDNVAVVLNKTHRYVPRGLQQEF